VHQPGGYLEFAAGVKKAVSVPVIAVGRIEPDIAEKVLARGEADFVAMGRKLLADPELPNKLIRNTPADIRPCIYCYTCVSQIFLNQHVLCAVNAQTGFETERVISPAPIPRNVVIVGGGPAGMEAARVASLRGHRVTLYEAGSRLGGTVFFSAIAYPPNEKLIENLETQLRQLPVNIRLNTPVDESMLQSMQADAVVLATGAVRDALPIEGAGQRHVFSGDELRRLMTGEGGSAAGKLGLIQRLMMFFGALFGITRSTSLIRKLSRLWMPLGQKVAIIGGGLVGVELAEFLAERGRQVVVIEAGEKFGVELAVVRRWRVLDELRALSVVLINKAVVKKIEPRSLHLEIEGSAVEIEADTVILAAGARENPALSAGLQALGLETHRAGDCDGVGYIEGAIRDGNAAGRKV
jgi:2,4-dienoyl-CoA reductase (NADPH2)